MGDRSSQAATSNVAVAGAAALVGREAECGIIEALIANARRSQGGVLLIHGEAGIGKSSLLEFAARDAAGMEILTAVGVEPEGDLAFAGMHQLLRPVAQAADRIPDAQANALRIAMGVARGNVDNRFIVALAVLSLLSEVATERPVLCLIDDAQWLDQPSVDALIFVARRLAAEGVAMLFSLRDGDPSALTSSGLPMRRVGALDRSAAERLLVGLYGSDLVPEVRRMIVDRAEGLPLALVEMAAALSPGQAAGAAPLPDPLPIGGSLEGFVLRRLRRLSPNAQMLLLIAAAEGSGDAEAILAAAGMVGLPASTLVELEDGGLVRTDGSALRFRHPILRSVIYERASLPQRQSAHRALAAVLRGDVNADRRAWHRAALVLHPDEDVADELERTARRARNRSGHAAAAAAFRRAAELTPSDEPRARRLASAARAAWDAGRPEEAAALARTADASQPETVAELLHVRGQIELHCGLPSEGATLLLQGANAVAGVNPAKALQMLFDAAMCANYAGDLSVMTEAGRKASELSIEGSDPAAPFVDLLCGVVAMLEAKDAQQRARLVRALDRVAGGVEPQRLNWAAAAAAFVGDETREETFRRRAEAIARTSMAVGTLAMVLERVAWTEMMHGRVDAASLHSGEGVQLAVETGLANSACFHRAIVAWAAAIRGDEERCLSLADDASEVAMNHGLAPHRSMADWAVGLLHVGLGRWDEASTRLEAMSSRGLGHPLVVLRSVPDLVEAAVRADRRDAAEAAVMRLTDYVGDDAPASELALAARCRALVTQEPDAKEELLSEALTFHERDLRPFSRARTLLLLGEFLRRQRRRKEARVPLLTALDIFEEASASPWAERTRRELRATGQSVRRRDEGALTELTLQERQIVLLVGNGATNRDVAAQLFLSPRTVEYHLRNVFSKLGISSRAELVRLHVEEATAAATD